MSIELRIRNLLNEGHGVEDVAETLLGLMVNKNTSQKDLHTMSQFFILSGQHHDFFRQFSRRFYEKESIAWPHFVEVIIQNKLKISDKIIQAIFEGSERTNSQKFLALNYKWQRMDIRMQSIRKKAWEKKKVTYESMRQVLKQKIEFLKNQRLLEDERKTFDKYKQMFPEDHSIDQLYDDFAERQARELINKKIEEKKVIEAIIPQIIHIDEEESKIAKVIFSSCKDISKNKSELIYDFAILFTFLDLNEMALQLIDLSSQPTKPMQWLRLELLLNIEDFFRVLSEAEKMEADTHKSPDDKFALIYIKARAYNSLNQKSQAVDLLKSIIRIRPNYRSAQSLLTEILEEGH